MALTDGTPHYIPGSFGHPQAGALSTGVPPVALGVLSPLTNTRSPAPPAPIPLSSLPLNLSSSQPPPYQPSPLPGGSVPATASAPVDPTSGIGGPPPPPPPTGGFVPSHGIVSATPGKVSNYSCIELSSYY